MTRGMYNEALPKWLQDIAAINGATIDSNPEEYGVSSIYAANYLSEDIVLEERRGSAEEIATILSGATETVEEPVEKAGYHLDGERHTRSVIIR